MTQRDVLFRSVPTKEPWLFTATSCLCGFVVRVHFISHTTGRLGDCRNFI